MTSGTESGKKKIVFFCCSLSSSSLILFVQVSFSFHTGMHAVLKLDILVLIHLTPYYIMQNVMKSKLSL